MTETPKPPSLWHRAKPWLGLAALFAAGALAGSLLTLKIARHKLAELAEAPPGVINGLIMNRLDKKLDLKADQKARIAEIVRNRQEKIRAIRLKVLPEIAAVLQEGRKEIEAELDPKQKDRFNAWADEKRAHFQKFLTP